MSEYQYYEFQTIDKPLNNQAKEEIAKLSSRVKLTATKAIFNYSYADFPAHPPKFLAEYFDAMYYIANWGTQQLMFRFPKSLVDIKQIQSYCIEDCISLSETDEYVILDICFNDEDGFSWIEAEDDLDQVIDLRQNILQQDYRLLYLAWLKAITLNDIDEKQYEPSVPTGLNKLSSSLNAFIELFGVDEYLVEVAAKSSKKPTSISDETWLNVISQLSREECEQILFRLLKGEPNLGLKLQQKLSQQIITPQSQSKSLRTISELFKAAKQQEKETQKREKEEAEIKRIEDLKKFATQEVQAWENIERLLLVAQAKSYDDAVQLLKKLRDLAIYQDRQPEFQRRLNNIYEKYSRRSALLRRLRNVGLNQQ